MTKKFRARDLHGALQEHSSVLLDPATGEVDAILSNLTVHIDREKGRFKLRVTADWEGPRERPWIRNVRARYYSEPAALQLAPCSPQGVLRQVLRRLLESILNESGTPDDFSEQDSLPGL